MAIRRTNTLLEPYTVISKTDDALDVDAADFEARWEQYLDGKGEPPLRVGAEPALFTLRHFRARDTDHLSPFMVATQRDSDESLRSCFAACLLALEKAENAWDDKGAIKVEHTIKDGIRVVSDATLDRLGMSLCWELGARALARLNLSPK